MFKSYSNSCSSPSDVTINLKDLKALVGLCVELGADVVLKFDEAGVPLLAVPHAAGVQVRGVEAWRWGCGRSSRELGERGTGWGGGRDYDCGGCIKDWRRVLG